MVALVGRDNERTRIVEVLASARDGGLVRSVRVVGASGMGKTALAQAVADAAQHDGWHVCWTTSYRLHAGIPLFAARRIVTTITGALGDKSERYTSGLNLDHTDPAGFEEAFFRFIEGVSLDYPLLLLFDDAQWSDDTSRALLTRTLQFLADRSIVLLSTERSDLAAAPAFDLPDVVVAIDELSDAVGAAVVRSHYPQANDDVINAIVDRAAGRPVDLVALAEAARDSHTQSSADVEKSMRRVVARDLAMLDGEMRTLLQVCSLLDEPIAPELLGSFWPDAKLLDALAKLPRRYLAEDGEGLRFVHASIMEAVRETIPIEIPLRRRIIDALSVVNPPTVETLERIIDQAEACGDRELQRQKLLELADAASAASLFKLEADALDRALRLIPASRDEVLPLYSRLMNLYNGSGLDTETIETSRYALQRAKELGITEGIGSLASSLIVALWHAGRYDDAEAEIKRYRALLTSPADQAQFLSVEGYIAAHCADPKRGADAASALETLNIPSPFLRLRLETTRAFLASRLGDSAGAIASIRNAEAIVATLPPITRTMPDAALLYHTYHDGGLDAIAPFLDRRDIELNGYYIDALRGATMLSRGEFEDAQTTLREGLVRHRGGLSRRVLLTIASAVSAFERTPHDGEAWTISRDERSAYERGDRSTMLVPIITAWAVSFTAADKRLGQHLVERLADAWSRPLDFSALSFPILLALAARNAGATNVLKQIAAEDGIFTDKQRWNVAQALLARGAARAFLKHDDARTTLAHAKSQFTELSAPFFARLAESLVTEQSATLQATLPAAFGTATRREREVAALVAEGLTNREIAEKLVLSERTVEGHIANLFTKVNVGSRTQLAAWFIRVSSVAS